MRRTGYRILFFTYVQMCESVAGFVTENLERKYESSNGLLFVRVRVCVSLFAGSCWLRATGGYVRGEGGIVRRRRL